MRDYVGRCPCGHVEVHFFSALDPSEFVPRTDAPTCAFCRDHDGVWISDPLGQIELAVANRTVAARFASQRVEFRLCAACDALAYALFEGVAVVRVALFPAIRNAAAKPVTTNFDGESVEEARQRRLARWTRIREQQAGEP